ncbi:hypothetical protein WJ972_34680 [Achromobacter insuavis]
MRPMIRAVRRRPAAARPARAGHDRPGLSATESHPTPKEACMRSILLWLLGVPIPIIILLALFWH